MNLSRRLRDEYNTVLSEYDVVMMPTAPQSRRHAAYDAGPLAWAEAACRFLLHYCADSLTNERYSWSCLQHRREQLNGPSDHHISCGVRPSFCEGHP
jgi:hypothetical protein